MNAIRVFLKFVFFVVEKVMAELALLAALFSITEQGTYVDRIAGGMLDILRAIYGFAYAYIKNIGFREFMSALSTGILRQLADIGENVEANPRRAFIALIATYITYKVIPLLLKLIRKKLLRRDKEIGKSGDKSELVKDLYEEQKQPQA